MTALVYGIVRSADAGWTNFATVAALAVGTVLLVLFMVTEWHARQPIMPLWLFASRERTGAYAGRILFLGAMMGFWFFITQYLQVVKGYRPLAAGIAFFPMTVVNFVVAIAVPRLTRRLGNGLLLAGGLAVTMVGMFWLSRLSADTSYLTGVALPMILIGAGQGAASGLANVAHQLGGSLGLGILVTVFAAADSRALDAAHLFAHRVAVSLTVGTAMLALVVALIVQVRRTAQLH